MSTTFKVTPNLQLVPSRYNIISLVESVKEFTNVTVEAAGTNIPAEQVNLLGPLVDRWNGPQKMNGFLRAIHVAFDTHAGLILSPDDIWVAIAQGFAIHVTMNAERLRDRFVKHEGQKYIEIQRNEFRKGSPSNDWMGGSSEFSDKIAEHIGKTRDLLVSDFSTTGPIEKAASEVVLMDTMKSYFTYGCRTCCGFPQITLLGEPSDWANIVHRAMNLVEFDAELAPWVRSLTIVLGEFVKASAGRPNIAFWEGFYKEGGGSGGPYVTGAVNAFFPYIKGYRVDYAPNKAALDWSKGVGCMCGGPTPDAIPSGLASVPFRWVYYDQVFPMSFIGGFVGTQQDKETHEVRPALGWGVADRKEHAAVDDTTDTREPGTTYGA
jgi:hypothetical protein